MVIVCRTCGTHSAGGDAFCGSCGGFLEWTGDKVVPKVSEEFVAEAEQEAAAPKRSLLQRVVSAGQNLVAPPTTATAPTIARSRVRDRGSNSRSWLKTLLLYDTTPFPF